MFIEKIHLENLASLKGKWTIDLTHPEYEKGIFAIVGTNGAGKSTIMDAICLALYGRTPRQAEFSESQNEIMSKGTQNCLAEVTFRTAQGRFTARWRHRRTKRKGAQNQFSNSEREFESLDGMIGSTKKKEIEKLVQEHVGLTFEQFTQSAMLAQFQFEKFLTSDKKERIQMLETLTGTGYFKNLVIRSQAIVKEFKEKIRELNGKVEGVSLLSPEEMDAKKAEQKECAQKKTELEAETRKLETLRESMNQWRKLQEKLLQNAEETAKIETQLTAFGPSLEKLKRAKSADPLLLQYQGLQRVRRDAEQTETALAEKKEEYETLRQESEQLETEKKKAAEEESHFGLLLQESRPVLHEIRGLDEILEDLKEKGSTQKAELGKLEAETQTKKEEFAVLTEQVRKTESQLLSLREELENSGVTEAWRTWETAGTHPILTEFYPLDRRIDDLTRQLKKLKDLRVDMAKLKEKFSQEEGKKNASEKLVSLAEQDLETAQKERDEISKKAVHLQEILKKRSDLSGQNSILDAKLQELMKNWDEQTELHAERTELEQQTQILKSRVEKVQSDRQAHESKIASLKSKIEKLRAFISGTNAVRELESRRAHLHEGTPCPLCGALEHPYAQNVPKDGKEEELELEKLLPKMADLETQQTHLEEAEKTVLLEMARCETQLTGNETQMKKSGENLTERWKSLCDECLNVPGSAAYSAWDAMGFGTPDPAVLPEESVCRKFQETVGKLLAEERQWREEAERKWQDLSEKQDQSQTKYAEAKNALKERELVLHEWEISLSGLRERVRLNEAEQNEAEKAVSEELPELCRDIRSITPKALTENDEELKRLSPAELLDVLETAQKMLSWMYGSWESVRTFSDNLEKQNQERSLAELKLKNAEKAQTEQNARLEECRNEFQNKKERRTVCLNGLRAKFSEMQQMELENTSFEASVFEQKAERKYETLQKNTRNISEKLEENQKRLLRAKAGAEHLENSFRQLSRTMEQLQTELKRRIQENGFADEEDLLRSVLQKEEQEALESELAELSTKKSELAGQAKQNQAELDSFGGKAPSEKTADELDEELERLKSAANENLKQFGMLEQTFQHQKEAEKQRGVLNAELEDLSSQTKRWEELTEILKQGGSKNSDSFENFVQGFTFRRLLHFANIQLQQINPRYQLRAHPEKSTVLQILDSMHEQSVRNPESLSGGETFILSLALALGLTRLASRNVEINSFFIDEGFGSLSQNSLKDALDVLKKYHAEARKKGRKLIGLISHVEAIQEEVGTFIQLTHYPPQQFSRIEGPGVTQEGR